MATPADYAAVSAALVKLAQSIIAQKNIPEFMVPADMVKEYADQAAKLSVDTLDAFRASEKGN